MSGYRLVWGGDPSQALGAVLPSEVVAALAFGYHTSSSFALAFRSAVGETLTLYRKRL